MPSHTIQLIASIYLLLAIVSFIVIVADILAGHRQKMWIMNIVWPLTALWAGPLALPFYYKLGRQTTARAMRESETMPAKKRPFTLTVGLGVTHCGSGCTLGDIIAESFVLLVPITFLGSEVFGTWILDFVLAFLIGIAFQYFTIKPMRDTSVGQGIWQAIKADTLSLTAWQVGMYGWMAIAIFAIYHHPIPKSSPVFWFMMQIAMLCGFATSYPVNWWLLRKGVKEAM